MNKQPNKKNNFITTVITCTASLFLFACSDSEAERPFNQPTTQQASNQIQANNPFGLPQHSRQALPQKNFDNSQPARAIQFYKHNISDPGLNNMVAKTILVPKGWRVNGGINRNTGYAYKVPFLEHYSIESPDGRRFTQFPTFMFQSLHLPNTPQAPLYSASADGYLYHPLPQSISHWIMQLHQRHPIPGANNYQIIEERTDPQLTAQFQQSQVMRFLLSQSQQSNLMTAGTITSLTDAQVQWVKARYNRNGKNMEQTILVSWYYNYYRETTTGASFGLWTVPFFIAFEGVAGSDYLNDRTLQTVAMSVSENPAWTRAMTQYWQQVAVMEREKNPSPKSHQANNNEDIQQTEDLHTQFRNVITEVTAYDLPSGETVNLPSYYEKAYYNDQTGEYILTDDVLYNPNADLNRQTGFQEIKAHFK